MTVSNVLVQRIIISVILVYVPQCRLDDNLKDDFYGSLINVDRKLEDKEIGSNIAVVSTCQIITNRYLE